MFYSRGANRPSDRTSNPEFPLEPPREPLRPPLDYETLRDQLDATLSARPARTLELELFPGFRRAAVLIPVLRRRGEATLLFTQRTRALQQHSGQISFPGGRVEPGESLRDAALRETDEEVFIPPSSVEIVGRLDDFPSISSYLVAPYIGIVEEPPAEIEFERGEVASVFEATVARALDPAVRRVEAWDESKLPPEAPREQLLEAHRMLGHLGPEDTTYPAYFFDLNARTGPVWGLTARILEQFLEPFREAE